MEGNPPDRQLLMRRRFGKLARIPLVFVCVCVWGGGGQAVATEAAGLTGDGLGASVGREGHRSRSNHTLAVW